MIGGSCPWRLRGEGVGWHNKWRGWALERNYQRRRATASSHTALHLNTTLLRPACRCRYSSAANFSFPPNPSHNAFNCSFLSCCVISRRTVPAACDCKKGEENQRSKPIAVVDDAQYYSGRQDAAHSPDLAIRIDLSYSLTRKFTSALGVIESGPFLAVDH